MKNSLLLLLAILITSSIYSCKKAETDLKKNQQKTKNLNSISTDANGLININVADDDPEYSTVRYTKLGSQYEFPFKTETIRQAWNNLSNNDIATLQPTHNYIKFTPQNESELADVLNSGLSLFDYPLDYYITEYGDMLEGTLENTIPVLYTFAPVGYTLPNVSYTTLYSVYFTELPSVVTEEAFNIAGLADKYPYYRDDEPDAAFDVVPNDIGDIMHLPIGWTPQAAEPYTGGAGNYNTNALDFTTHTPTDVTEHCNCTHSVDYRKPSGCVLVEETQFAPNWQGVRRVGVSFVGPFGQLVNMQTNEKGCYSSNQKIYYKIYRPWASPIELPVVVQVKFKSDEATVRSLVPGTLIMAMQPVRMILSNISPYGLDNKVFRFFRAANAWQLPNVYYTAASLNNAHYEYKEMNLQDGITPMHSNIQYLLHPYDGAGGAPMLHKIQTTGSPAVTISQGVILRLFGQIPGVGFTLATYLAVTPPDIAIGTEHQGNIADHASDQIREVMYHEMGHATHYRKTGNAFWIDLVAYEALMALQSGGSDSYGDGTATNADVASLAEMWGYHIGYTYTHRRYGVDHSRNGLSRILSSWYWFVENIQGAGTGGWIPAGLLHDLMDNNIQNNAQSIYDISAMGPAPGANDNVGGFTNLMFYNELGSQNIGDFRDNLRTNQLPATGNSVTSYNTLVGIYGL